MKESFSSSKVEAVSDSVLSPHELEMVREDAFRSIILSTMNEKFHDHLDEAGFDEDEVRAIESSIAGLSFKDAAAVFGIPSSISVRKFKKLLESVNKGELKAADIPQYLLDEAKEKGFGIGYHNAPREVRPDPKTGDWYIRPTDEDHRDSNMPRAYYATSYKTLYRSKHSLKFLYIVRTMDENSKTDGNWSRTNALSIIDEVPLDRIDKWVNDAVTNRRRIKKADAAH